MFKLLRKTLAESINDEGFQDFMKQIKAVSRRRLVLTTQILSVLEIFFAVSMGISFVLKASGFPALIVSAPSLLCFFVIGRLAENKKLEPRKGNYILAATLLAVWLVRGIEFNSAMTGVAIFLNLVVHCDWQERKLVNLVLILVYTITVVVLFIWFQGISPINMCVFLTVVITTLLFKKDEFNDAYFAYGHQENILSDLTITEERATQFEIKATHDKLTGILNRGAFDDKVSELVDLAFQNQVSLGLIMIDIDHFKWYNDTYGHVAGDKCLQQVAQIINKSAQRENEFAFRYGGEEFCVLVYDTDIEYLGKLANFIHINIENAGIIHETNAEGNGVVTLSLGGLVLWSSRNTNDKQTCELLKTKADKCLYISKETGRNKATIKQIGSNEGTCPVGVRARERRVGRRD